MLELVQLLRLPGDARALVSAEVAALGEKLGELRRLDVPPDPHRQPMKHAGRAPQSPTKYSSVGLLGEIG